MYIYYGYPDIMISKTIVLISIALLLFSLGVYKISYIGSSEDIYQTKDFNIFYNTNATPKTFEDLFLPNWLENCSLSFKVPEYMHYFNLAFATTWAKAYQYGYETGREANITIADNDGNVYLAANNSAAGVPVGGAGRYNGPIKGDVLFINVTGKIHLQLGVWGEWTENILSGGTYKINFTGSKIALYMYYYKPSTINTFYFKSSKPVYASLISADGAFQSKVAKPTTKGALKMKYDGSFLTFEKPNGVEGNITIQFWAGYGEKKSDPTGALFVVAIMGVALIGAYIYSKKSTYGPKRRNKK